MSSTWASKMSKELRSVSSRPSPTYCRPPNTLSRARDRQGLRCHAERVLVDGAEIEDQADPG